ncbi:MAG: SHOCT domain-containing protein [Alphaproteobacteria bacterium]|nr:SHOCT domain-containing protein [Alphaproteobacteria bacterium]MBV9373168.1 SHOCT domain-containing protein [Alphaproteobacteria bacterium]MBV9900257.1 SHOCT domain-containing protein [Alphaproteobacteria bacterium]
MSSRYDSLERLQRLRESGALTDEEFQAEKRRLLGHGVEEPEETPAAAGTETETGERVVEIEEAPQSRLPLFFLIGAGILIVAIILGLLLGRFVSGPGSDKLGNGVLTQENVAEPANVAQPEAPPDVRSLAPEEQLARAFEAAFGSRGAASLKVDANSEAGGESFLESVRYTPGRLVWTAFGPVLLSEGKVEDPSHASTGKIAVHYLKPVGDRFEVARAFPAGVVTGSSGTVARWSVSPRFSDWPMIVSEGGGMWQGYACSWAKLTEVTPQGPVDLATVPLSYDDTGAKGDEGDATTIEGRIINVDRNQSFDVVYKGSRSFSEHWVRSGSHYQVVGGKSQMETC